MNVFSALLNSHLCNGSVFEYETKTARKSLKKVFVAHANNGGRGDASVLHHLQFARRYVRTHELAQTETIQLKADRIQINVAFEHI